MFWKTSLHLDSALQPETKSAKSDAWLGGGPVTSVTGDQVCYLSEHGCKPLVLDVQS